MLLKISALAIAAMIAIGSVKSAIHTYNAPRSGVTVTATCPEEDTLWEHPELCVIDVQPSK